MLAKIFVKFITVGIIGCFLISCAPKYTAHFQQKSHEMTRYTIADKEETKPVAFTDAEQEAIIKDIEIKEVVLETKKVQELIDDNETTIIRPKTNEELIQALKDNPNATVAVNLDKKERKVLKREVKEQLRETRESANMMQYNQSESKLLYYILAILLPPLAVGLWRGIGSDFWINVLLTLLLFLPGIIHAIIVISSKPKMNQRASF